MQLQLMPSCSSCFAACSHHTKNQSHVSLTAMLCCRPSAGNRLPATHMAAMVHNGTCSIMLSCTLLVATLLSRRATASMLTQTRTARKRAWTPSQVEATLM